MGYTEFITNYIRQKEVGQPIYSADIALALAKEYRLPETKAGAAVAVAIKRILDGDPKTKLRFYQKGIYYLTENTPFGEVGINTERLIADKYLSNHQGYETGLTFMNRLGLTTQFPRSRELATNTAKNGTRYDAKLEVVIRPPKVKITAENMLYLQILDAMEDFDKAPVDSDRPYLMMAQYIRKRELQYGALLAYADAYYGKNTLIHLAHTAREGGNIQ